MLSELPSSPAMELEDERRGEQRGNDGITPSSAPFGMGVTRKRGTLDGRTLLIGCQGETAQPVLCRLAAMAASAAGGSPLMRRCALAVRTGRAAIGWARSEPAHCMPHGLVRPHRAANVSPRPRAQFSNTLLPPNPGRRPGPSSVHHASDSLHQHSADPRLLAHSHHRLSIRKLDEPSPRQSTSSTDVAMFALISLA